MSNIQDTYRGTLLGLAVGDALGGPLEFMTPSEIIHKYGRLVISMVGGGWLYLRPGETTDDTATMRCLAESLIAHAGLDTEDLAARLIAWIESGPKDVGTITRMALRGWARGLRAHDAAHAAHTELGGMSAGNGTLMRCAPLALLYRNDEQQLIAATRQAAEITHFDALAWTSDVALNLLLVRLLRGEQPRPAVEAVAERLRSIPDAAAEVITVLRSVQARSDEAGLGTSGFVLHTLEGAIWLLLRSATLEQMLVRAVNLGGDADTLGAVCGALGGARWGAAEIPARWLNDLEGRAQIAALADQLLELSEHAA